MESIIIGVLIGVIILLGAFVVYLLKFKGTTSESKPDSVQVAIQGILNSGIGAVLIVTNENELLFYNDEFEQLFPVVKNVQSIAGFPELVRLFDSKEYVSEELSKIYDIRTEMLDKTNVSGKFVWLVDMTDHYKTNKKLKQLKEMADEANKAKSNFLTNMSHEIRTPINTVLGMDEIILRETTEVAIRSYAENIREAGTTLLSLVNDLLDFSKIECGKMEILQSEYEVAKVFTEIINMIEIKAVNKGLSFIPVIAEDIPYLLWGDEIRMKQVIINLLTNAVKYTQEGSVVLKVDWSEAGDSSINLIVSVTDTGIGIKEEDMNRLFVSFERIEEERNRNIEGTGLGISISKQLLELMDSNLNVRSQYGVGSTFYFTVKQGIRDRKPIGKFREKYAYKKEKYKQYRTVFVAPSCRVLVVDDNAMNLSVVEGLLKNTQITVDKASGGLEALDMCKDIPYDIVLMDHMMPYVDGIETLHRLKEMKDSPNCDTPVIVLTANAISGVKEMYLREGFADYMSKPIQGKRLEEKLLEYLPADKYVMVDYDEIEKSFFRSLWQEVVESIQAEYSFKYLDIASAIESSEGDKECFQFLLQTFSDNVQKGMEDIQNAYDSKDFKNYTIFVHALKSTSKMVGAEELSEQSKLLEMAGKEENSDYIEKNHGRAMKMYQDVVQEIDTYLSLHQINRPKDVKVKEVKTQEVKAPEVAEETSDN